MLNCEPGRKCGKIPESTKEMQSFCIYFLQNEISFWQVGWAGNDILQTCLYVCMLAKLLQECLTLCDPMDYSPPGSSVHRILQGRGVARPSTSAISPSADRSPEAARSRGASSLAQGKVLLSFPIPNSNSHSPLQGQFPESKTSFSLEELGAQSDYLTSQMIYQ